MILLLLKKIYKMELKTLKDLEECGIVPCTGKLHQKSITSRDLKAEAVKWVKYYRNPENQPFFNNDMFKTWFDDGCAGKGIELFLINFFNLIEEDLK